MNFDSEDFYHRLMIAWPMIMRLTGDSCRCSAGYSLPVMGCVRSLDDGCACSRVRYFYIISQPLVTQLWWMTCVDWAADWRYVTIHYVNLILADWVRMQHSSRTLSYPQICKTTKTVAWFLHLKTSSYDKITSLPSCLHISDKVNFYESYLLKNAWCTSVMWCTPQECYTWPKMRSNLSLVDIQLTAYRASASKRLFISGLHSYISELHRPSQPTLSAVMSYCRTGFDCNGFTTKK